MRKPILAGGRGVDMTLVERKVQRFWIISRLIWKNPLSGLGRAGMK